VCTEHNDLPPVDHWQGFQSKEEVTAYLASFTDRPDGDVASRDLWGRETTFGDLRKLVQQAQKTMLLPF
jgi:hypothetical protein